MDTICAGVAVPQLLGQSLPNTTRSSPKAVHQLIQPRLVRGKPARRHGAVIDLRQLGVDLGPAVNFLQHRIIAAPASSGLGSS